MEISNKNKIYKKSNGLVSSCQYHVIFCPKYKRKVLIDEIADRFKEVILALSAEYDFEIMEMDIMPDNVHLLIDCSPEMGILECIKKIKNTTAKTLKKEFPELKSRLPCLWTRNVFVSSVGEISIESIKMYLEEQINV